MTKILLPLVLLLNLLAGLGGITEMFVNDRAISAVTDSVAQTLGPLDGTLCSRKPHVPFMVGAKWFPLPAENIFETCTANQVDYILITAVELNMRPQLRELLRAQAYTPHYHIARSSPALLLLARS